MPSGVSHTRVSGSAPFRSLLASARQSSRSGRSVTWRRGYRRAPTLAHMATRLVIIGGGPGRQHRGHPRRPPRRRGHGHRAGRDRRRRPPLGLHPVEGDDRHRRGAGGGGPHPGDGAHRAPRRRSIPTRSRPASRRSSRSSSTASRQLLDSQGVAHPPRAPAGSRARTGGGRHRRRRRRAGGRRRPARHREPAPAARVGRRSTASGCSPPATPTRRRRGPSTSW